MARTGAAARLGCRLMRAAPAVRAPHSRIGLTLHRSLLTAKAPPPHSRMAAAAYRHDVLNSSTLMDVLTIKPLHSPRRLVDVHAHTTIADALAIMRKDRVTSIAVYGEKGHYLGAGESLSVCTVDRIYVGVVTVLDIILFLAANVHNEFALQKTRIFDIIGSNTEGLSLFVGMTDISLLRAIEPMSKGVHRLLVPIWVEPATHADEEVMDEKPRFIHKTQPLGDPNFYTLVTQSDVMRFINENMVHLKHNDEALKALMVATPQSLGLVRDPPMSLSPEDPVLPALTTMAKLSVTAVPILDPETGLILSTLSTSDFRAFISDGQASHSVRGAATPNLVELARDIETMTVAELVRHVKGYDIRDKELAGAITCFPDTPFAECVATAVSTRVHRLWVVDAGTGAPMGVVSLGDMIHAITKVWPRLLQM